MYVRSVVIMHSLQVKFGIAVLSFLIAACAQSTPPTEYEPTDSVSNRVMSSNSKTTLTGQTLREPSWPKGLKETLELDLKVAQAAFKAAPDREESYIWLGRRNGYLERYDEAIAVFTAGLVKFPNSYKLLRFRGRHFARNREFERAIADYKLGLSKMDGHADVFEPDGIPNSINLTISTYRRNLHYYLGQTSFATGDYIQMFEQLELSKQPLIALPFDDHQVAVIFWQYIALKKLARSVDAEALLKQLPEPAVLLENKSYYDALLILSARAEESNARTNPDNLSKFALGMKLLFDGDKDGARNILGELVAESARGYWPAEVELLNLLELKP